MTLAEEIKSIPVDARIATDEVAKQFFAKLHDGGCGRDEDPIQHFGVSLRYITRRIKLFSLRITRNRGYGFSRVAIWTREN